MHKKYLMASHGKLASGLQSSIEILAGKGEDLNVIDAYLTEEDFTPQVLTFIEHVGEDEQGVIFTDFFGGSVNQKIVAEVMKYPRKNIFVLANANLPLVLSVMLSAEKKFTSEILQNIIDEATPRLVSFIVPKENEHDALDDFF